jgi:FMN phosphatase YigB (HAD superfamily)
MRCRSNPTEGSNPSLSAKMPESKHNPIRTIFFDFDGVLTLDATGSLSSCRGLQTFLPNIPLDQITSCYRNRRSERNKGQGTHLDYWQEFKECLGVNLSLTVLDEVFKSTPKNEEMFKLAEKLQTRYALGIITDNSRDRFQVLEQDWDLPGLFSLRILSADVGTLKDSPVIFEKAEQEAGCKPGQCAFIDNNKENLVIPRQRGWKTFWHNDKQNNVSLVIDQLEAWGIQV